MAYMWNPNDANNDRGILTDRIDDMPSDYLLAIDTVETVKNTAHKNERGFNVLRVDGSVSFKTDADAWDALDTYGGGTAGNWTYWNEIVDRLLGEYPAGRNGG